MGKTSRARGVVLGILAVWLGSTGIAHGQDELGVLLERSGARIEEFWEELSQVACTEEVFQWKLDSTDEVLRERRASYDYLIVVNLEGSELRVEESRLAAGDTVPGAREGSDDPMLVTSGFSTMLLVFHPYFRDSYTFRLSEEDPSPGGLREVRFEAVAGRPTPAALRLRGRNYPIQWRGSAWLDPRTGMVERIEAGLKDPMDDLGLVELRAETQYRRTEFRDPKVVFWMPDTARVDVTTRHQRWRNLHRFSDYRLFSVESELAAGILQDPEE